MDSIFAKIGIGAVILAVLALIGKLTLGLLLVAAYCLWRGRKYIGRAIHRHIAPYFANITK